MMQAILIVIAVILILLFVWCVSMNKKQSDKEINFENLPSPHTLSENLKTQAIEELSKLDDLRQMKQYDENKYYKTLYFIVTTLSELRCLKVIESKYKGRGWFIKAEREELFGNNLITTTIYYPSFGYGEGSGSAHFPLRYLKTKEDAEQTLHKILETRVEELPKKYKLEIDKITLWED